MAAIDESEVVSAFADCLARLKPKEIKALLKILNIDCPEKSKELQIAAIIQNTIANIQRLPPTQPQESNKGVVDFVHQMGLNNSVSNLLTFAHV